MPQRCKPPLDHSFAMKEATPWTGLTADKVAVCPTVSHYRSRCWDIAPHARAPPIGMVTAPGGGLRSVSSPNPLANAVPQNQEHRQPARPNAQRAVASSQE